MTASLNIATLHGYVTRRAAIVTLSLMGDDADVVRAKRP